jgi:hypothetical protein
VDSVALDRFNQLRLLLEREPATSIGGDFELSDITRRREDHLTEVATRLG